MVKLVEFGQSVVVAAAIVGKAIHFVSANPVDNQEGSAVYIKCSLALVTDRHH